MPVWIVAQSLGTILSIRLCDRLGPRLVSNLAIALFALAHLAMVFVRDYWQFVAVYGGFTGLTIGLGYMPALLIAWTYYPAQKSLVTGVSLFSAGIAASLLSPVSTLIVNPRDVEDYQEDKRVYDRVPLLFFCLFLYFAFVVGLAAILQPPPFESKHHHHHHHHHDNQTMEGKASIMNRYSLIVMGDNTTCPIEVHDHHLEPEDLKGHQVLQTTDEGTQFIKKDKTNQMSAIMKEMEEDDERTECPSLRRALTSWHFASLCLMAYSCSIYNYFMNSCWKEFYETKITATDEQMALILTYGAFANSAVRVLAGLVMLRCDFRSIYLALVAATVLCCFTIDGGLASYGAGVAYAMTVFGGIGVQVTIFPTACTKVFGATVGPKVFPFIFGFFSLANLTQYFVLEHCDDWAFMFRLYGAIGCGGLAVGLFFNSSPDWSSPSQDSSCSQDLTHAKIASGEQDFKRDLLQNAQ